jgi:hypothetical protein
VWGIHVEVAGMTFYHQGSANLIDDAIRHSGVDVFLAGIAGRGFTRDYWARILPRLQPRTIVAPGGVPGGGGGGERRLRGGDARADAGGWRNWHAE